MGENRHQVKGLVDESLIYSGDANLASFLTITVENLTMVKDRSEDGTSQEKEKAVEQIGEQLRIFNNLAKEYLETKEVLKGSKNDVEKGAQLDKYAKEAQRYEKETIKNFPATTSLGKKIALGLLIGSGLLLGGVLGAAVGLAVGASTGLIGHVPGMLAGGAVGTVIGAIKGAGIGVQVALGAAALIFGSAAVAGIIKASKDHPDKKHQREFLDKVPRPEVTTEAQRIRNDLKRGH